MAKRNLEDLPVSQLSHGLTDWIWELAFKRPLTDDE
jgi:hypothetical protein